MKGVIYIAGPMSGIPQYNFPAFDEASESLEKEGWIVINPAEMDREVGFDPDVDTVTQQFLDAAMVRDVDAIMHRATAMAMLPGWERSRGALAEKALAEWKRIPVYRWPTMEDIPRQSVPAPRAALSSDPEARKRTPVASGVLDYFPDALAAVAHCSWVGSQQHNPGKPMCWDRTKSKDHPDALIRHFLERGSVDSDGVLHSTKVAWRALALLQAELEGVSP